MQKIRLAVIYGGPSVEHEIAIISAVQAMAAVDLSKYDVIPIFITKEGQWYTGEALKEMSNYADLKSLKGKCQSVSIKANRNEHRLVIPAKGFFGKEQYMDIDVMFPVMHGAYGEDGCLQGLLEILNIPYAGPSVLGAAVGMDKIMMKNVLEANGLPVVEYCWFTSHVWFDNQEVVIDEVESKLGYPVIVKPANLGSSVGINKANNRDELIYAFEDVVGFTERLLVERCVTSLREINCSVLGGAGKVRASVCEEPITDNDFLTYQDKYMGGGSGAKGAKGGKTSGTKSQGMSSLSRQIPANLPVETSKAIQDMVTAGFVALDGFGVARIDVIIDEAIDKIYINEINTIPGSLSFYLWEATDMPFNELIDELVNLALKRKRNKEKLTLSYDTNILAGFKNGGGGTKGAKGAKM